MQFYYPKIDPYTNECMHNIYGFWLTKFDFLTNYTIVTHDNYNITKINEAFIHNFFATTL
jgi:hypothetical protein